MDLSLSDEQLAFRAASREMLECVCSSQEVHLAATPGGSGHSEKVWGALAKADWLALPFVERFGGAAASLFDVGLAYCEAGRALVPTTLYSTLAAGLYIANVATAEQQQDWLPPLCQGETIATLAFSEPAVFEDFDLIETTAARTADGWVLDGTKAFVANAARASVLVALARVEEGPAGPGFGLFAIPGDTGGVRMDPYLTFGQDALFEVTFDRCPLAPQALLGGTRAIGDWRSLCAEASGHIRALQCMEMLGGIEAVLDRTVRYVSERHQFGVPIGSFQAVQHHLAGIAMRLKAGRIAAFRALWAASEGRMATREVTVAELWLSETYVQATLVAHQVWGGMGYSIEGDMYLYSQRAKTLDLLCGRRATRLESLLQSAAPAEPRDPVDGPASADLAANLDGAGGHG